MISRGMPAHSLREVIGVSCAWEIVWSGLRYRCNDDCLNRDLWDARDFWDKGWDVILSGVRLDEGETNGVEGSREASGDPSTAQIVAPLRFAPLRMTKKQKWNVK